MFLKQVSNEKLPVDCTSKVYSTECDIEQGILGVDTGNSAVSGKDASKATGNWSYYSREEKGDFETLACLSTRSIDAVSSRLYLSLGDL